MMPKTFFYYKNINFFNLDEFAGPTDIIVDNTNKI